MLGHAAQGSMGSGLLPGWHGTVQAQLVPPGTPALNLVVLHVYCSFLLLAGSAALARGFQEPP